MQKSYAQTAMLWIGTIVYFQLVVYLYVNVVVGSRAYDQIGVMALEPTKIETFVSLLIALLPVFVLPRRLDRPSTVIVIYLYYMVFLPSCAITPYASYRSIGEWSGFLGAMAILMAFSILFRPKKSSMFYGIQINQVKTYNYLLIALCIIFSAILLYFGEIDFRSLDLLDVYEKRSALIDSQSTRVGILFYVANMAGYSLAPISLVYGIHTRSALLIISALIASFFAFAFTSYKSELIVPVMSAIVYLIAIRENKWGFAVLFLALIVGIAIVSILWDWNSSNPLLTWTIHFRLVGNNGFLSAKYADFFAVNPPGLFADSIGRIFNSPVYDRPIAQIVGESFSSVAGNHANVNIWGDGYGNFGYVGMGIATLELIFLMWVFDTVAFGEPAYLVAPMAIPAAFSMSNTAVHSSITSNGVILGLILIALMPRMLPKSSRA